MLMLSVVGRDSSVGIATRYGLGQSGDRIAVGARFSAPAHTGAEVHPACYTMGTGSFSEVKRPGRCVDHPPPSSVEVKETEGYTSNPPVGLHGLF